MYTITSEQFASMVFGILMSIAGILLFLLSIRDVLKYGMDESDLVMLLITIVLLSLGVTMILVGFGILVII